MTTDLEIKEINNNKGSTEKARLEYNGTVVELPVVEGTEQEKAVDISNLRADTGLITLDNGYMNTGSCQSDITFIDGEKGILRYRGIDIEALAERSTFVEVCYLLIYGELPTKEQMDDFSEGLTRHSLLHEDMIHFFAGYPSTAHPMAILSSMTCSLAAYYNDASSSPTEAQINLDVIRILSKLRTIASFSYKKSIGQPLIYPNNKLTYCANIMNMMFAVPSEEYYIDDEIVKVMNQLLILHADHEQNCSTSTVRMVQSSGASIYACMSAGISALWGPLHGGANQAVLEMLQQIHDSGENYKSFLTKVKDKKSSIKLMGFGHRVYKNFDPRAKILRKACDRVLDKLGISDPLLEIAKGLEEEALKDPYFVERKLYPNVDFYSGIIYSALGIPVNMFTVMFALGRLPGWLAHWKEQNEFDKKKICRPRQVYTGYNERLYVPLRDRN
ncbi:MAG: citrate synthase [Candidatus Melainabacteria bacterium]|jgi:citrate synthase|nr:citrate synthase [Cyanobacteria bacterium REEB446]MEB3315868.1 citrate synthase [Candidatus Melainabacteria bacterium]NBV98341.1 citrate synthase [Pseudomonadota bacterium]